MKYGDAAADYGIDVLLRSSSIFYRRFGGAVASDVWSKRVLD